MLVIFVLGVVRKLRKNKSKHLADHLSTPICLHNSRVGRVQGLELHRKYLFDQQSKQYSFY